MNKKIIVLDDDPTGIQSVHDILVITNVSLEAIIEAFQSENQMFYILTNSRSFNEQETILFHQNLIKIIIEASVNVKKKFVIVSRSDSTLRGHYPLENEVIKNVLEANKIVVDGEIICPYLDGCRKTINDIHYVINEGDLIPCGESEFSKDKTFGYKSSDLKEYIEEKSKGKYTSKDCVSISLRELKNNDHKSIVEKLENITDFKKIIVNADCMEDLNVFTEAYERITSKTFLFRCAASLVKCLGHIDNQPLLTKKQCTSNEGKGICVLVGSHVNKTATQLLYLKEHEANLEWITFNQHLILNNALHEESKRVSKKLDKALKQDKLVVVTTRRERVDYPEDNPSRQLDMAIEISHELTNILKDIDQRPRVLITKGGITSSDAITNGLYANKEWVLGQILPSIGVISCMKESRFPGLAVVIFPGNVGEKDSLYKVVEILK